MQGNGGEGHLLMTAVSAHTVAHAFSPALRKQRQPDPCEFKASLIYIVTFRTVEATE